MIGIGSQHFKLAVYIGNRPPLDDYQNLDCLIPALEGELARIVDETGNHWRKIINIYAKLGFSLNSEECLTWQSYRDTYLLTELSPHALLFDSKLIAVPDRCISIITGKSHANTLLDIDTLIWLDDDFAVEATKKIIVAPYFDYRQLSNIKLSKLVCIINELSGRNVFCREK